MVNRFLPGALLPLILIALAGGAAADSAGKLTVSGAVPVELSFDRKGEPASEASSTESSGGGETDCSGGGLVGRMNCVTKRIEGAGGGGAEGEATGTAKEGEPDINVTMSGSVTPQVEDRGDGTYVVTLRDAIGMPQFSPGTPQEIMRSAAADEAALKLGLRDWRREVTRAQLEQTAVLELSFAEPFSALSLFKVNAPTEPVVKLHWEAGPCDDLHIEYIQAQQDYQEAMAAMPVLQQFELVTRTMDEMESALAGTATGMKEAAAQIGEVTGKTPIEGKLDELMENTSGLSSSLTDALERIKGSLKEEQNKLLAIAGAGEKLNQVKGGLEQGAKTMTATSKAVSDLNDRVRQLEELIRGADKKGSEQLIMFRDYFGAVRGILGPLKIPVVGDLLDLYAQAIEQIAVSAEQLEAEVNRRNLDARRAGLPYDPYVQLDDSYGRFKRRQNELYERMQGLANRLKRECPTVDLSVEVYGELQAIRDARPRAVSACEDQRPDLQQEARTYRGYREAREAWQAERGNLEALEEQMGRIKADHTARRTLYEALRERGGRPLTPDQQTALDEYFEAEPRHEYEQARERMEGGDPARQDLGNLRDHVNELAALWREKDVAADGLRALHDRFRAEEAAYQAQRGEVERYNQCLRGYMMRLASQNDWDPELVELEHDLLFR